MPVYVIETKGMAREVYRVIAADAETAKKTIENGLVDPVVTEIDGAEIVSVEVES